MTERTEQKGAANADGPRPARARGEGGDQRSVDEKQAPGPAKVLDLPVRPNAPRPFLHADGRDDDGGVPAAPSAVEAFDLRAADLYLNRELTWLQFNFRVLNEARDERNPILERTKFLAIADSNMDEFFMKRIGGLKQQIGAGVQKLTVDGRNPSQQLEGCRALIAKFQREKQRLYRELLRDLRQNKVIIHSFGKLSKDEQKAIRDHYYENIFPLVTPLAMDPAHPFPFLSNLSLNLLVTLRFPQQPELTMARVKVPVGAGVPRFLRVGSDNRFVMLEDVMAHCLGDLFPGMEIASVELFRVTRNANTERDEEQADDLVAMIEAELRERKFAPIVRLQTETDIDPHHRGMLAAELGLDEENDVYESDVMIGMRDLMELAQLNLPELHEPPHQPITNVMLQDRDNIFHIIRENGPILLHHPYELFATSVVRFVREAATDPKVYAIKMTLYRTSADTNIIDHLIEAARNGKQVAVVVELKARFDEAANIQWAGRMEEAGIHVTYGVLGLKTHAKLILVVRRDYNGLRRYIHIGTGNYHAGNARQYSDLGVLAGDRERGLDVGELFNYLTTGCRSRSQLSQAVGGTDVHEKGAARQDRARDRHSYRGHSGVDPVQGQRPGGPGYRRGAVSGVAGGGQGGVDHPRYLPPAPGYPGAVGKHHGDRHRRPFPRAYPDLLLP